MVLAATLICGASVFTSCTNSDNPVVEPDLNVAEKITGKWMVDEIKGQPCPTNWKTVLTFVSPTQAYGSMSDYDSQSWNERAQGDVSINGNNVIIMDQDGNISSVFACNILSISDTDMLVSSDWNLYVNGISVQHEDYGIERYVRITSDYKDAIIGMWEGVSTDAEDSEFDDGENHRWEYLADGTFNYFNKVNGQWQISDDEYADYFVDGTLLCTRWKNAGAGNEEHREWWEIESIENGVMKWKALRQREDGTTFTSTFEMKKVEVSPIDNKCARAEVVYRIKSSKDNYTFYEGKYAVKSGNEVKEIKNLVTFAEEQNEGYNINDIAAFPVEEAICLHYGIKDGLESYAGDYSLNWEMSYTVTSYNAKGDKLDSQTISDKFGVKGKIDKKEDLEMDEKMSYSELHASVAEDGKITLSIVNKMHPEKSGIDW